MVDLNVNNLQIGEDGRVSFSGLGSGIDFEAAVDGIIAAKRIPIDRLEAKIETNAAKTADLGITRTLTTALQESLQQLHGAVTFDSSSNLFESKQAFASATRTDGASASAPVNILGVSVTSGATAANHTVEVIQTARAHRVGSDAISSTNDDLGTALGLGANTVSGEIEIAGVTLTVLSTDNLNELADRFNAANSGENATGVSASIVSTGDTENFLVLTVDDTGQTLGSDISLTDTDGILENLGVLDSGGGFANELQAARKAQVRADGLLDGKNYSSGAVANSASALGLDGVLSFSETTGAAIGAITYTATDSVDDIADLINNDVDLAAAGITATVTATSDGDVLQISGGSAFNMTDSSTLLDDLEIEKDQLIIERDNNTISDLFDGVTLTLFQAEEGTTINIDIEKDLTEVKTGLVNFVNAYNDLRQELNRQLKPDPATGSAREDTSLFGNSTLEEIDRRLEAIIGAGADGVDGAFTVLAQIGIDFITNGELTDDTLADTLTINEEQLDEALLTNLDDVRKMFEFDFTSSDPRVVLLGFDGSPTHTSAGYTLDIDYDEDADELTSVTLNDGAGSVDGQLITIDSGGAQGLRLLYTGDEDVTGIDLDFTVGIGAKLFFDLENMLDSSDGIIAGEVDNLADQTNLAEERSTAMLERLDRERDSQLQKFIRMETALATMRQLLEQITQITDALFQDR